MCKGLDHTAVPSWHKHDRVQVSTHLSLKTLALGVHAASYAVQTSGVDYTAETPGAYLTRSVYSIGTCLYAACFMLIGTC